MELKKVPVIRAAQILGKSPQFVRCGLRAGKLPFGIAVKGNGKTYSYHISPKLFMDYTGCDEDDIYGSDCNDG